MLFLQGDCHLALCQLVRYLMILWLLPIRPTSQLYSCRCQRVSGPSLLVCLGTQAAPMLLPKPHYYFRQMTPKPTLLRFQAMITTYH